MSNKALPPIKVVKGQLAAEERLACQQSFETFFKSAWANSIEPRTEFEDSPHYKLLFEWAQILGTGEFKKRYPDKDGLIIDIPPRSLKSTIFNIALPVWVWLNNPDKKFLCISYGNDLAVNFSVKRRDLIRSKWFKNLFPEVKIKPDMDTKGKFNNDQTGYMICGSPGAIATGFGGNIIIVDDLLKADDAYSKATRESANRFFDGTLTSRRNNPAQDVFLIVNQRLHESDIVGHLTNTPEKLARWVVIDIPMEAEETKTFVFPISGTKWLRKAGNVLLPKMNTRSFRNGQKARPRVWSGQYQQKPSPPGGFIFDPDRWGSGSFYDPTLPPPDPEFQLISVDCAWKSADENDFTAIHCYGINGANRWLLDFQTERMNYIEQCDNIRKMRAHFPKVSYILIEEAANGYAVIKQLSSEMTGITAIKPEGGKESRAVAASADQTHTFLPDPQKDPRVQPLIDNFAHFAGEGTVEHDDDIDAYSQAMNWLRERFWSTAHLDKEYEKTLEHKPEDSKTGDVCPGCGKNTVAREGRKWSCTNCPSTGEGNRMKIIRAGF